MRFSTTAVLMFAAWLLFISGAPAPYDNLDEGLVAHYTFNHCDARDESGLGSHGEMIGNVGCWCGVERKGLLFDGREAYLRFPGPVNQYFTESNFTISFYFKPEGYSLFPQSMISKREDCDEYNMLDILFNSRDARVETLVHETPEKYYPELSPDLQDKGGWVHYVLVREGFKAMTYINGQLQNEGYRCSGVDLTNEAFFSFGNSPCVREGRATRFKGVLDELRVYDRALSADEVLELYNLLPIENIFMDCDS
ncbi:MAG: LamG domain-containing protein [Rhodobacteraceae bacterium]|nr:LamG domain-containing protein [Lewinella sp.]MCB2107178.1 LamG domain-containing protein [Paracoccaceae bacterium]MCB9281015.1 LamG domain-containing protein [Lewinellaceae bacterium]